MAARARRVLLGVIAAAVVGPALAQPSTPVRDADALPPQQRELLAPWLPHWERLGSRQRAQLLENARLWSALTPEQQDRLRARLTQWRALSPAERVRLRQRHQAYLDLPQDERERVRAAFEQFHSLAPEAQQALREEFAGLPPTERRAWVLGAHASELAALAQEVFAFVPLGEREATLDMLRTLRPPQQAALQRIAARLPPWRRDEMRRELLALEPHARAAYLDERLQR